VAVARLMGVSFPGPPEDGEVGERISCPITTVGRWSRPLDHLQAVGPEHDVGVRQDVAPRQGLPRAILFRTAGHRLVLSM
jgi:hypothetical protein